MSKGYFIFNGIRSSDYGVWTNGYQTYDAAARDYEEVLIPGRDGVLTLDNGRFNQISQPYECFIVDSYQTNIEGLRNALMAVRGTARLTDSYHPTEFYKAYYERGLTADTLRQMHAGSFTVEFTRDPRRFLTSGETTVTKTASGSITNPTLFASRPNLRVYGTGTLGVSGVSVSVNFNPGYIDIDCDMQDCYYGTTNCNSFVTFSGDDFPVLNPGSNTITLSGITRVIITPNWYIL